MQATLETVATKVFDAEKARKYIRSGRFVFKTQIWNALENQHFGFLTRCDTNQAVQSEKTVRSL